MIKSPPIAIPNKAKTVESATDFTSLRAVKFVFYNGEALVPCYFGCSHICTYFAIELVKFTFNS